MHGRENTPCNGKQTVHIQLAALGRRGRKGLWPRTSPHQSQIFILVLSPPRRSSPKRRPRVASAPKPVGPAFVLSRPIALTALPQSSETSPARGKATSPVRGAALAGTYP